MTHLSLPSFLPRERLNPSALPHLLPPQPIPPRSSPSAPGPSRALPAPQAHPSSLSSMPPAPSTDVPSRPASVQGLAHLSPLGAPAPVLGAKYAGSSVREAARVFWGALDLNPLLIVLEERSPLGAAPAEGR